MTERVSLENLPDAVRLAWVGLRDALRDILGDLDPPFNSNRDYNVIFRDESHP